MFVVVDQLLQKIFAIGSDQEFNGLSLEIFRYQYLKNKVYRQYVDYLGVNPGAVSHPSGIPFLPIELFKTHMIMSGEFTAAQSVFASSGTTSMEKSKHFVADISVYQQSFIKSFEIFYGSPNQYLFIALLPSYLEQGESSLIYMVDKLIRATGHPLSGFYTGHDKKLHHAMANNDRKVILLGVTYALLDLAEEHEFHYPDVIVMETGGMKGRRKEMIRDEVHEILCSSFHIPVIHSEYGMTELLSQAYSSGKGKFRTPPWMKVLTRDVNDPLSPERHGRTGGLNIIDLANIHSCSFIATQDLGKTLDDGSFEVLGRYDTSDIRGCNLMVD